jgi:hypothetical protein
VLKSRILTKHLRPNLTTSRPSNCVVGEEGLPAATLPSPGGCAEHISIFLREKRVPRDRLKDWTGKLTGLSGDGEEITLKLVGVGGFVDRGREGWEGCCGLGAVGWPEGRGVSRRVVKFVLDWEKIRGRW